MLTQRGGGCCVMFPWKGWELPTYYVPCIPASNGELGHVSNGVGMVSSFASYHLDCPRVGAYDVLWRTSTSRLVFECFRWGHGRQKSARWNTIELIGSYLDPTYWRGTHEGTQGQVGWGPKQPELVPAHSRKIRTRWFLRSLPTQCILCCGLWKNWLFYHIWIYLAHLWDYCLN